MSSFGRFQSFPQRGQDVAKIGKVRQGKASFFRKGPRNSGSAGGQSTAIISQRQSDLALVFAVAAAAKPARRLHPFQKWGEGVRFQPKLGPELADGLGIPYLKRGEDQILRIGQTQGLQ